ncbi:MAG: flagellar assembly peptidoglycan hydrolase FlgJ [Sterolibacteriaceae bacterium]|uniref:flagellar assembly peptidoglycan hydrolase FlgJ n=1 Tax=Sulfuritalea sp. TaxID=2480090 RepID=UPI001A5F5E56|nr:flagellar assembly peptidoglycan hydrolase FlgJ [Sulfuritalea sp.]MBL8477949.1 flagellar assembly peptidoglycan hydrolase FlgJ [Sterolibacteriaceae bacterium]MBN8474852.1 flagellar assembly peptidoglycan hydrolase FlgJ [Sulfuritalea sp.]
MTTANSTAGISVSSNVLDTGALVNLKRQAKSGDPAANKAVAKQFEALFMQMVLKSMRAATPREGLLDSEPGRLYESLLDQQLSLNLGGGKRGLGLAEMIEAQLNRQIAPLPTSSEGLPLQRAPRAFPLPEQKALPMRIEAAINPRSDANVAVSPAPTSVMEVTTAQRKFVDRLLPSALAAERSTGIPAHFMMAQAALETGWGRHEPVRRDGSASFNIFGIKAGAGWNGPTVEASTTEVVAGLAQTRVERFRAYASYEQSFNDYARLLKDNPRYADVLGVREPDRFARGLQAAGYATDPQYASKLERIIGGPALQQAMNG